VTIRPSPASVSASWYSARVRIASLSWMSLVTKIAERYWEPMSLPWRSRVVGSWVTQNTFSSSLTSVTAGS